MAQTKAKILTFVNRVLGRSETDIDIEIQEVLDDLSEEGLLVAQLDSVTIAAGDKSWAYPTLFKSSVAILFNDGSFDGEPLQKIRRGYSGYLELMRRHTSGIRGYPRNYAEFNKQFFPYPVPQQTYTIKQSYRKFHAKDVSSIEFGDEFQNALFYGAAWFVATNLGLTRYINIWEGKYLNERHKRTLDGAMQPSIVN